MSFRDDARIALGASNGGDAEGELVMWSSAGLIAGTEPLTVQSVALQLTLEPRSDLYQLELKVYDKPPVHLACMRSRGIQGVLQQLMYLPQLELPRCPEELALVVRTEGEVHKVDSWEKLLQMQLGTNQIAAEARHARKISQSKSTFMHHATCNRTSFLRFRASCRFWCRRPSEAWMEASWKHCW